MKFTQLCDDSKDRALKDFMNFYLSLYLNNNLEFIAMNDNGYLVDINNYIFDNISFPRKMLLDKTIENRKLSLEAIIKKINQSYDENGNVNVPWEQLRQKSILNLNKGKQIPKGK